MLEHRSTGQPIALASATELAGRPGTAGTSFIGSFVDEPEQAQIVLRGDIDAGAVDRVGVHIEGLQAAGARFLEIDAAAVDSYDQALLDLLGRTQRQLGGRRGMLRVRGLHPSLLAGPPMPAPAPRGGVVAGARHTAAAPAPTTGLVPRAAS